jgi:hypothetical protein
MKKLILAALLVPVVALAQTFPSPTFNSLTLQNPLSAANGGTGATTSTGSGSAVLSNSPTLVTPNLGTPSAITLTNATGLPVAGLAGLGTGVASALGQAVTGSGGIVLGASPTISNLTVTGSLTATGLFSIGDLAAQSANTVVANTSASSAIPVAASVPSCSTASSALQWTSGSGFGCNTAINASSLGGNAASTYAPLASPTFTGSPVAPTASRGANNTSVATTAYVAKSLVCPSIMDHGGDNTNTNDNSAAFLATIAANPTGSVCVDFPPGTYKFSSAASYTNPTAPSSIMIRGSGQDVTTLNFPNANNGIVVTSNAPGSSAHIRDMTVTTGQNGGFSGILLTQTSSLNQFAGSDIYNVTLRGSDNGGGGGSHFWTDAILINGQDNVNVESVTVYGAGANSTATGAGLVCQGNGSQYAIYVNISKSVFNNLGTGVVYGSFCQGMTITQSNFQNDFTGFLVPPSSTGELSQLQISDSQFANSGNEISINSLVGNVMIHHNDIFVHTNTSAIFISPTASGSITGNNINKDDSANTGTNGIVLGSNAGGKFTIGQNQIGGLTTCIWYQTGSSGNVNLGNALTCTTPVVDQGTSNTSGMAVP